jgi:hypothetical protein
VSEGGDRANELWIEARRQPHACVEKVDLLEAAARHADAAEEVDLAYSIRDQLINAALDAGEVTRSLVAFSWCLARCDAEPQRFPETRLHWRYKWILEWAPRFPEVPRAQIDRLLADVDARFSRRGVGRGTVAKLRAQSAMWLGDDAELLRWYEIWKAAPRDGLSDCQACDLDEDVMFLIHLGRDREAVEAAETLIQRRSSCAEVPHITHGRILLPLLKEGRVKDADTHHRRGYTLLKSMKRKLVGHLGEHLLHTAVVGDLGRGLRMFKDALPDVADHPVASSRLTFVAGAHVLLDRIGRDGGKVTLAVPASLGGDGASRRHDAAVLAADLGGKAREISARLDARNGNDRRTRWLEEWMAFKQLDLAVEYAALRGKAKD